MAPVLSSRSSDLFGYSAADEGEVSLHPDLDGFAHDGELIHCSKFLASFIALWFARKQWHSRCKTIEAVVFFLELAVFFSLRIENSQFPASRSLTLERSRTTYFDSQSLSC